MKERYPERERKPKGRRRLGLEKIKPSDGTDTCIVVIQERGREERESGLSPIGERVETLTLFFIFPNFRSEKSLILKIGYLFDYNFKSLDFGFIGFLFSSAFRG